MICDSLASFSTRSCVSRVCPSACAPRDSRIFSSNDRFENGFCRIIPGFCFDTEFESPADLLTAINASSEFLNINLDIGHFYAAGYDPVSFIREHHSRIVSLHVKDRDKDAEHTQRRFGQAATPIVETMKLLKQIKFKYAANIEYEPEMANPTEGTRTAFEFLRRALS